MVASLPIPSNRIGKWFRPLAQITRPSSATSRSRWAWVLLFGSMNPFLAYFLLFISFCFILLLCFCGAALVDADVLSDEVIQGLGTRSQGLQNRLGRST